MGSGLQFCNLEAMGSGLQFCNLLKYSPIPLLINCRIAGLTPLLLINCRIAGLTPLLLTPLLFGLFCGTLHAEPWGKDADLALKVGSPCTPATCRTPVLGPLGECLIRFHQEVISPADGPRSHHKPSSSQYTLDAMRKYGFFYGFLLGCDRLMRENDDPWVYPLVTDDAGDTFKWDPVK